MKMKKNIMIYAALVSLLMGVSSCSKMAVGKGDIVTQQRTTTAFTSVKIDGSANVTITQGNTFSVSVSAYENVINWLETSVTNGELVIGYKNNTLITNGNARATITMPAISGLTVSGSGDFFVKGNFVNTGTLNLRVQGSGNINIDSCRTDVASLKIDGSGNINSFGLVAKEATVHVAGSGDSKLTVTNLLDVIISGSGSVQYKGNPQSVNTKINGSGRVHKV